MSNPQHQPWQMEFDYTFEDYREGYLAQHRSLQPKSGARTIIAWIVFLLLLAGMALFLHLATTAGANLPPVAVKHPATAFDIILRIIVPTIPWVLIGFLLWHFMYRMLRAGRRSVPVEQYIATNALPYRAFNLWIIIIVAMTAIVPLISSAKDDPADPVAFSSPFVAQAVTMAPLLIGITFIWFIGYRGVQKALIRRQWIGQPLLQLHKRATFDEAGVRVEDAACTHVIRWAGFLRFVETPNLFLLFISDYGFHMIPMRAMEGAGEVDRFRQLLRARIQAQVRAFPVVPILPAEPLPPLPPPPLPAEETTP